MFFSPASITLPRSSIKSAAFVIPVNLVMSVFLPHFFLARLPPFLSFICPGIVSVSLLSCGLPSCPFSLIQALNFHSQSLTQVVKLNYSHYLAISLHTHSLCTCLSFSPLYSLLRGSRTPKCVSPPLFIIHIGRSDLLVGITAAHVANSSLSMSHPLCPKG